MRISQEGNLVTLINVFETKPEQQQALIEQWIRFTEEEPESHHQPAAKGPRNGWCEGWSTWDTLSM